MEEKKLEEAISNIFKPLFDIAKDEKPKFWYDPATNRTGYQTRLGKKTYSKCRDEDTYDKYVGCALCIAKNLFGGNKRFREFVDKYWVGKQPYGYEVKEWVSPYLIGERVLFLLEKTNREQIGTILAVNQATKTYVIESAGKEVLIHLHEIIRKCRKANKPKEVLDEDRRIID